MRSPFSAVLLGAALLALVACVPQQRVHSTMDPQADFERYRSFGFVERPGTDRGEYTTLLTARLMRASRMAMEARGYRYEPDSPDLLINFNVSTRTRVEATPSPAFGYGGYYGYRAGYYGPWMGWNYDQRIREYSEGTVNVDIVDARERRLVWEGVAVARLGREPHRTQDATIDAAITEIFARYPHSAGARQPIQGR